MALSGYNKKIIFGWAFSVLLIAGLAWAIKSQSDFTIDTLKEWIRSWGFWSPVFFILIFQIRIVFFIPMSVMVTIAGVLWGLPGLIYVISAVFLCASFEFLIARYFFREKIERRLKGKVKKIRGTIEKHGFVSVVLVRVIPNIMFDMQNMILAVTKVRYGDYIVATLLGMLPACFILVFAGDSLSSYMLK